MDINRLCPGCMREVGIEMHKAVQGVKKQGAGMQEEDMPSAETWKEARHVKMRATGMQADGAQRHTERAGMKQNRHRCPYCGYNPDAYKQNARCLPINTILAGKYLVGAVLGEGGFGITYIGYDLNMQTRIAIKEYFPVELVSRDTTSMTGDRVVSMGGEKSATYKQGLKKYVAEAQNVSQFSEIPGVVSVKDFFYENETAYIVMEYIEGISLKDYLKERGGRLSEEESLAIMKPVLEALVKVHEAGIIHRDISPDNIMLTFRSAWDNGNIRGYGNVTAHGGATGHGNATGPAGHGNAAGYGAVTEYGTVTGYGATGQRGVSARDTDTDRLTPRGQAAAGRESAAARTAHGESGASDMAAKGDGAAGDIASVKLIDFGAARMTAKNDQKSLTIILKHGYAPEEQYRTHGEQGPWTDVYAVCAVLYRMLTGQTPVPAMDRMFQDGLKSFDDLNAKVSRNIQAAILKGLAVKKEDRIQTMGELIQALYEGRKVRTGRNIRLLLTAAIGGTVILAAAIFLGIGLAGRRAEPVLYEDSLQSPEISSGSQAALAEQTSAESPGEDASEEPPEIPMEAETLDMEQEDEEIGEKIVESNPQTSFDGSAGHAVIRLEDGTVASAGSNQYGQRNLSEWDRIAAVAAGDTFTAGLREDGRVLVAGELTGKEDVERWEGILAITGCDSHLYGLTAEGTVVANQIGRQNEACMDWTDVKAISAGPYTISALTQDGRVLTAAGFSYTPAEITGWEDVRYLACSQYNAYGIREDGSVAAAEIWSDIDHDTLNHEEWKNFRDIVQLYVFHGGVYGVDRDGGLHVSSSTGMGGVMGNEEVSDWSELSGVTGTVWDDFRMMGLRKDGTILKTDINVGHAVSFMSDLKKVVVRQNHHEQMILIGITQEGQLLYSGETDGTRLDEVSYAEDVYVMDWWWTETDTHSTCAYLDTDGNLWMEQGDKEYNDIRIVDSAIRQIIPVYLDHGENHGNYIAGLHEDGTVTFYKSGIFEVPEGLNVAEGWTGVAQLAGSRTRDGRYVVLGLMEDGSVKAAHSDGEPVDGAEAWTDIQSLYSGDYAVGAVKTDGTALFLEDAPEYNYGQYNTYGWTDLTQLAMGLYHTAGLREDGTVCAVGRNDAGQCDVESWTDIVYIEATDCATLGIQSDGTLVIAGEVGW